MANEKEMTAPVVSVGADTEQSSQNCTNNSLTDFDQDFKGFDEMQREILRMMDPSYLKTVSMSELLDNVYQSKPPLVDGLLYRGTYLFVGALRADKAGLYHPAAHPQGCDGAGQSQSFQGAAESACRSAFGIAAH